MLHYFISEAEGVCGASISGQIVTYSGWSPSAVIVPDVIVLAMFGLIAIVARRGTPP